MNIYLDIETIPTQRTDIIEDIRSSIKAPGNYKKPDSIQKWFDENGEQAFDDEYRKTALNGTFGEIICIGWAIDDNDPMGLIRDLEKTEKGHLQAFVAAIDKILKTDHGMYHQATWIGHNILNFDLRYIWQRCVINDVKIPFKFPYNAKYWDENIFDTLYEWTGNNKAGGSLDKISKALGYDGKGEINGANVWDYFKAGELQEICEYCKQDVELTRQLYKRMTWA